MILFVERFAIGTHTVLIGHSAECELSIGLYFNTHNHGAVVPHCSENILNVNKLDWIDSYFIIFK